MILLRTLVYAGLGVLGAYVFIKYLLAYALPFLLGVGLASAVNPAVEFLSTRARLPRGLAVGVSLAVVIGGTGVGLGFGFARLVGELTELSRYLPYYYTQAEEMVQGWLIWGEGFLARLPPQLGSMLEWQLSNLLGIVEGMLRSALMGARHLVGSLPGIVAVVFVAVITAYFVSRDRKLIRDFTLQFLPPGVGEKLRVIQSQLWADAVWLVKVQLALVCVTGSLVLLGLWLGGFPYALSVALVSAILDIVPVLGPGLVFVPWATFWFLSGEYGRGAVLALIYLGISAVRQVLEVVLVGERVGLHPLGTLAAIYVGVKLFGPAGFIIGPLVTILLKASYRAGLIPPMGGKGIPK